MSTDQIIRAWKDENYRSTLSDYQRAQLPPHPAGLGNSNTRLNSASDDFEERPTLAYCGTTFFTKCF
jgi:mersacidin/lichenicidin family type 2 lantibiotic